MTQPTRTIITGTHLVYAAMAAISVMGAGVLLLPFPYYLIPFAVIGATAFVVATFKHPFFGVCTYMLIYFFKPQEFFPANIPYERGIALVVLATLFIHIAVREKKLEVSRMDKAIVAFMGACFLSIPLSGHIALGWEEFFELFKVFLVYIFMSRIANTPGRLRIVIWMYMISIAFIAATAFYNYYTGNFVVAMGIQRARGMAHGAYADANSLANSLVLGIPFLYYMMRHYRRPLIRLLLLGSIGLCLWTIIITGSRGGMLGALAVIGILAWFSKHRTFAVVAAMVAVIPMIVIMPQQYKDRFMSIVDIGGDSAAAVSARGRIEGILLGAQFFYENPLTGAGIGNFPWKNFYHGNGIWLDAHNLPGKLIGELGLLGVLSFSWLIYAFIMGVRQIRFKYRERDWPDDFNTVTIDAIKVSFAMLFFQGLWGHNLYRFNWYIFAGFVWIISSLVAQRLKSEEVQPEPDAPVEIEVQPET